MKRIISLFFILLSFSSSAKEIKLTYEPKGIIVCFDFLDSIKVYTDTSAIMEYINKGKDPVFKNRVRNYFLKRIKELSGDTLCFNEGFIEFNDNESNSHHRGWDIVNVMISMTKKNKVKIIEKSGRIIKVLTVKKKGTKKKGHIRRSFCDKQTKKELFSQTIYFKTDMNGSW